MNDIEKALLVLAKGGVIAHPTDTCYGLTCDVFNSDAMLRLYKLKKMPVEKPVSMMVANISEIGKYAEVNEKARDLIKKFLPGALTIILPRKNLPSFFNPGHETIGIRVPDNDFCISLSREFVKPLVTTSANISGKPSPYSVEEIEDQFADSELKPDLVIDGGILSQNKPSTIVKIFGDKVEILRQGDIKLDNF